MSDTGLNSPETSRQPQRLPEIDTRTNPSDPVPAEKAFFDDPMIQSFQSWGPISEKSHCVYPLSYVLDTLHQLDRDAFPEHLRQHVQNPGSVSQWLSSPDLFDEVKSIVLTAIQQRNLDPIRSASFYQPPAKTVSDFVQDLFVSESDHERHTVNAWRTDFKGEGGERLKCILEEYMRTDPVNYYARFTTFCQSSGTGKSRMVNQLGGHVVTIPACLADETSDPPLASTFQDLMTSGMQFRTHNPYRIRFFEEVVECATDFLHRSTSASHATADSPITYTLPGDSEDTIVTAGSKLVEFIRARQPLDQSPLTLLLCFDEAHPLLRHRSITAVDFDILAKKVKLAEEPSLHKLASTDFIAHLGRPLFGTRYDSGGQSQVLRLAKDKLLCASAFDSTDPGQTLACLGIRLGLVFSLQESWEKREVERKQVERHMRLCLAFDPTALVLETISPSEPLLAEAARDVMRYKTFAPAVALSSHITNSSIDIGTRGEMIAALWWILARDQAVAAKVDLPPNAGSPSTENDGFQAGRIVEVPDLLKALIDDNSHNRVLSARPFVVARDEERERSLQDAFSGCYVYFNHFVRVVDRNTLDQDHLWRVFCRGAAIICVVNQQGIDILIPFLRGYILKKENIGVILIQVKNDKRYGCRLNGRLFDAINPQRLGLCTPEAGHQIPIIRVVMALASEFPAIEPRTPPVKQSKRLKTAKYTAYDLWLAGRTAATYKPIAGEASAVYDGLLRGLAANYDRIPPELSEPLSSKLETVYRRMNAAAGYDAEYYDFYTEYDDENGEDENTMVLD